MLLPCSLSWKTAEVNTLALPHNSPHSEPLSSKLQKLGSEEMTPCHLTAPSSGQGNEVLSEVLPFVSSQLTVSEQYTCRCLPRDIVGHVFHNRTHTSTIRRPEAERGAFQFSVSIFNSQNVFLKYPLHLPHANSRNHLETLWSAAHLSVERCEWYPQQPETGHRQPWAYGSTYRPPLGQVQLLPSSPPKS